MANQLQTSLPRQAGENEVTWLTRIIKAIKTDIEYIASLFNKTYSGIFINGDGDTVTVDKGLIVSVDPAPPTFFKLTWDAIGNALCTTLVDYNTALGSDFTTFIVDGNDQLLSGNSTTFAMPAIFNANASLIAINDEVESVTSISNGAFQDCASLTTVSLPACTTVGTQAFSGCTVLTTASFPACTSVGDKAFRGCIALTSVDLTLCADLGGTTGNDEVFLAIAGQTITLTIPVSLQTCDGDNPDGDIVYLSANNTATIIYV